MRRCLLVSWLVSLSFLSACAGEVWAQGTGGSFGGGSFGGSSSSGGSSSGGSSGSSSSGSSSSGGSWGGSSSSSSGGSWGSSGGGDSEFDVLVYAVAGVAIMLVVLGLALRSFFYRVSGQADKDEDALDRQRLAWESRGSADSGQSQAAHHDPPGQVGGSDASSTDRLHVTSLSLGIDWRARRELQAQLLEMARSGKTGTAEGRAELLRETSLLLIRAQTSWLYAAYHDLGSHRPSEAEGEFHQAADDARSRFRAEVIRSSDGEVRSREAPEARSRPEEGPGMVVVTVVTASQGRQLGVSAVDQAGAVKDKLRELGALTHRDLAALEVIWSPAAEDDRLSSAELEQLYPELHKIDPQSIAGRVFCEFCDGPFAMELMSCPHCGAPVQRHEIES